MMKPLKLKSLDFEARVGFTPGKFTSPNRSLAFILAMAVMIAFYGFLLVLPQAVKDIRVIALFVGRGYIPYVTMLAFFWGMALLWLKSRKAAAQGHALKRLLQYDMSSVEFGVGTVSDAQAWLKQVAEEPQEFMLLNRLQSALGSLANLKQVTALPGIVNSHAEADEAHVEESYSFVTMLLYAIPVLGFIGTVLGLGEAIGGFGATLAQGTENMEGLIDSLKDVAGGLAVAFDTTLLALVGALVMQIYASFVRARETDFLDDCHTYFQNEFFARLRLHNSQ